MGHPSVPYEVSCASGVAWVSAICIAVASDCVSVCTDLLGLRYGGCGAERGDPGRGTSNVEIPAVQSAGRTWLRSGEVRIPWSA